MDSKTIETPKINPILPSRVLAYMHNEYLFDIDMRPLFLGLQVGNFIVKHTLILNPYFAHILKTLLLIFFFPSMISLLQITDVVLIDAAMVFARLLKLKVL